MRRSLADGDALKERCQIDAKAYYEAQWAKMSKRHRRDIRKAKERQLARMTEIISDRDGALTEVPAEPIAADVRTELGSRLDAPTLLYGLPLILRGRLAWAHDFVNNPALNPAFESLPGASFTVNGAQIPPDSALTSAGAELFITPRWTLLAKFDGEFANGSQTYTGSGTLRYTW